MGRLAKTDDVIARFADAMRPEARPLPDADAQELSALVAWKQQVMGMLVAEKNRLQ